MPNAYSTRSLVSLGANLGNAKQTILNAAEAIRDRFGERTLKFSQLYQTSAVGGPSGQEDFFNAVVQIESDLTAFEVWQFLHSTEQQLGRHRQKRWEARRIDLDVLLHQRLADPTTQLSHDLIWTPTFKVPHPRMTMRTFVLSPACDIASEWVEPVTGQTLGELSKRLNYISQENRSPSLFLTCDTLATIESLSIALEQVANISVTNRHDVSIIDRYNHRPKISTNNPWIIACVVPGPASQRQASPDYADHSHAPTKGGPEQGIQSKVNPTKALMGFRKAVSECIASIDTTTPPIHFDHWIHVCRSPDPSISHWEDFCRPWAEFFGMSRGNSEISFDRIREGCSSLSNTPPYLLAADDMAWAAHELIAASDAMTCPIYPCGKI